MCFSYCETMLSTLKSALLGVPLQPYEELPFRLALYHSCENVLMTLTIAASYMKEFGAYWLDALESDVEDLIRKEREKQPRCAEPLFDALEVALVERERVPSLALIEMLDLASLAYVPSLVGEKDLKKASLGISLGLHVERKHKKALRRSAKCLAAMSGAVLGEQ